MKRLTEKTSLGYWLGLYEGKEEKGNPQCIDYEKLNKTITKLGQLEDIEDELGIDLLTLYKLFNAAKVWAYSNNGKVLVNLTGVELYSKKVHLWNGLCSISYPLSEYGKSFALTEEELS